MKLGKNVSLRIDRYTFSDSIYTPIKLAVNYDVINTITGETWDQIWDIIIWQITSEFHEIG
jgi:hypothetical protein